MERDPALGLADVIRTPGEAQSAVSWGAVIAGAIAALALSFVLEALAAGFGMKLVSPWPGSRAAFTDFTPILGAWMIVVQVLSSALGGYLAGRLRTKWLNVHGHEVHFRDTAHGLLVWAVSTVVGVVLVATVLAPSAARVADSIAASAIALQNDPAPLVAPVSPDPFAASLQLRAEREAHLTAQLSLFMGVGLLLGAFIASVAAAVGGLRRDEMHETYWTEQSHGARLRQSREVI